MYLAIHEALTFGTIKGLGRGMFNAVGLFILVAFLGYGLVEVPLNHTLAIAILRYYAQMRAASPALTAGTSLPVE